MHGLGLNKGVTVVDVFVSWTTQTSSLLRSVGSLSSGNVLEEEPLVRTSGQDLFNEILVGVLCHTSALIGIKENVINVKAGHKEDLV